MADRIIKSDSGNDTVIQNNSGSRKIEVTNSGDVEVTGDFKTTTLKATNIKANDGTTSLVIADSTGQLTSSVKIDLNGNELILDADADTSITADTDDRIDFRTAGSDRVHIDSSGNFGINISSPSFQLSVENTIANTGGNLGLTSSDSSTSGTCGIIHFGNNTDSSLATISGIADGATDAGALTFNVEATGASLAESMRISSSGKIGINNSNPGNRLSVYDDVANFGAVKFQNDGNDNSRIGIEIQAGEDTPSFSGRVIWARLADGDDSGKAYIQFKSSSPNAEFAAISDERLKTDISDTDIIGLDVLNSIKMRKFNWDEEKTKQAGWSQVGFEKIGYIAQEVEKILPEFVSTDPRSDFKTMGDAGFIPYLIKAIQELSEKVTTLEKS
tara:strand:+ start:118 stop:1281 length:1164 start_codon:yes stop_codon:yes gene_type:complete